MNTKSSPSRYRYCISRRSTMASPTFTPALNVRSTTAPFFTFRSLVRTNAPPFPGFTCWKSMTWKSTPSSSKVIPRLRSFVLTLIRPLLVPPSQDDQVPRGPADHPGTRRRHLDHVLDADTAPPLDVDAWLHRD